jgi:hypothetical protein
MILKTNNQFEAYYYNDDEDETVVKVKARDKVKEPKIMFARWGGMNPKRDKNKEKHFRSDRPKGYESFHKPPENTGIYAFIWPYITPFLAAWNKDLKRKTGTKDEYGNDREKMIPIKKFTHHGEIWTHMVDAAEKLGLAKEIKGSWVKVDSKDLPEILAKTMAQDIKSLKKDTFMGTFSKETISNPYKRGKGGFMSKDHLEVFIPNKVKETKSFTMKR